MTLGTMQDRDAVQDARRARTAVFVHFLVQGILWGSWAAQIPFAVDRLGVATGAFGAALLSLALGAILSMPLAGALVNRVGSRAVAQGAGIAVAVTFLGPTLAPTMPAFVAAGLLFGFASGAWEVGLNAQGVAAERRLGRSVMSMLHGAYSVGGMAGAILGGAAIGLVGAPAQAVLVAALSLGAIAVALPLFLPAGADRGLSDAHFGWPTRGALGLGLLCLLALMSEGALLDWSALFLREVHGLPSASAGLGFGLFSAGMAVSRLTGDRARDRIGAARMVRLSAGLMTGGMVLALIAPGPVPAIAALALVGLGIGNLVPILFAAGGKVDPRAPARGIAAVSTLGYAGFLAGPPLIGMSAERIGLGGALWVLAVAGATLFLFAGLARIADRGEDAPRG